MKKIGILTLVFDNYGTRLQSYALCQTLSRIVGEKAKIEVINLEGTWGGKGYAISKKKQILDILRTYGFSIPRKIWDLVDWKLQMRKILSQDHSEDYRKRSLLFKDLNTKIPYSERFYTCDDLRNGRLEDYDTIIVGSDQVWNGVKVGNQDIFMLDFLKGKKGLTYAASFGMTTFPENQLEDYKRRINNFDSLLIREIQGVYMCKQLGRSDAHLVVDPTLLLRGDDYMEVMNSEINIDEPYVLVYSLNNSLKIYEETYHLAKKNNCKMVMLKRSFVPPLKEKYPNSEDLFCVSPAGFLTLIKNAQCIVTNSYHALLFSLNFNRPFYLYLDNSDEENSRLTSIVGTIGCEDRIYMETGQLPSVIRQIDYASVNMQIEKERENSLILLETSLNAKLSE